MADTTTLPTPRDHNPEATPRQRVSGAAPVPPQPWVGAEQIETEHPAMGNVDGFVGVDVVRVVVPRAYAPAADDLAVFVDEDGKQHHAARVHYEQGACVLYDIVGTWRERIMRGAIVSSAGAPPAASDFGFHPDVSAAPPVVYAEGSPVEPIVTLDALRSTAFLRIDRIVYKLPFESDPLLILERRVRSGLPTVDYTVATYQRKGPYGPHYGTLVHIDFGPDSRVRITDSTARRAFGHVVGQTPNRLDVDVYGTRCTHPTFDIRVAHYGQASDPVTRADLDAARFDPPVARFDYRYGTAYPFLSAGTIPETSEAQVNFVLNELAGRYPHIVTRGTHEGALLGEVDPDPWETRMIDQAYVSNQAGSQRYGVQPTATIFDLSPYEAFLLAMDSASGELLRGHVWLDDNGQQIIPSELIRTHNRQPHKLHSDEHVIRLAGLDGLLRIDPITKRSTEDAQHTDDKMLHAALALFDRADLRLLAMEIVNRDVAEARNFVGWHSGARGEGRPWGSAADAKWLFDGSPTGEAARLFLDVNFDIAVKSWDGRKALGNDLASPVTPFQVHKANTLDVFDHETGERLFAFYYYEEGVLVSSIAQCMNVMPPQARAAYAHFGYALGRTLVDLLPIDPATARPTVPYVIGVPGNPNDALDDEFGALPPAEALVEGTRENLSWTVQGHDGWVRWAVRGVHAYVAICAELGVAPDPKAHALIAYAAERRQNERPGWRRDEWDRMDLAVTLAS